MVFPDTVGDKESEIVLSHLEQVDDECTEYGIHLVKTTDHLMAKKYKVRHPPGLVYFRKGKEILFQGNFILSLTNVIIVLVPLVRARLFDFVVYEFFELHGVGLNEIIKKKIKKPQILFFPPPPLDLQDRV